MVLYTKPDARSTKYLKWKYPKSIHSLYFMPCTKGINKILIYYKGQVIQSLPDRKLCLIFLHLIDFHQTHFVADCLIKYRSLFYKNRTRTLHEGVSIVRLVLFTGNPMARSINNWNENIVNWFIICISCPVWRRLARF